jgi:hypothetical protein
MMKGNPKRKTVKGRKPINNKEVQAVVPFRVSPRTQLVSVPSHNYQLHMRRVFRLYSGNLSEPFNLDLTNTMSAVREELGGITDPGASTTIGETFAVHSLSVYGLVPNISGSIPDIIANNLLVLVYDVDVASTAPQSNLVSSFQDFASPAGVAHVKLVFPVNRRPTWHAGTPNTNLARVIRNSAESFVVIDADITYTRTREA